MYLFNNSNNNNNILNDINYITNNAFRRNKFSCYYYLLLYFLLAVNYAVRIYYVKCVSRMTLKKQKKICYWLKKMVYKCFRVGLKQNGCTLKLQFVNFLFRGR